MSTLWKGTKLIATFKEVNRFFLMKKVNSNSICYTTIANELFLCNYRVGPLIWTQVAFVKMYWCAKSRVVHDLEGKLWASFEYSIFS